MTGHDSTTPTAFAGLPQSVVSAIHEALERLRFGIVQLTVHDGKVVQLEVTEKLRF